MSHLFAFFSYVYFSVEFQSRSFGYEITNHGNGQAGQTLWELGRGRKYIWAVLTSSAI
jgi:hypothetical protein